MLEKKSIEKVESSNRNIEKMMNQKNKNRILIIAGILFTFSVSSFKDPEKKAVCSLKVVVNDLRNSNGVVVFALYNRNDAFPDEHYKKYFKKLTGKITDGTAKVTFEDLPAGQYACNILHDEDNDGKIKKGMMLPKEGIGFSNYQSIGLFNKPSYEKASFNLQTDEKILIKIIYM